MSEIQKAKAKLVSLPQAWITGEEYDGVQPLSDHFMDKTGYGMVLTTTGGGDGICTWRFSHADMGYVQCHQCGITICTEPGQMSLPSPWRRCEHMLGVWL